MTLFSILFYFIAALILAATAMAVTRRNLVHAVVYLVLSFFGTAMLFYLLGAPFLAALEVIIYAGAIMVLFLFIIMMIRVEALPGMLLPKKQLLPALCISAFFMAAALALMANNPQGETPLTAAQASPRAFGTYLFQHHWLAIEIASMLLLVALVGALILGWQVRRHRNNSEETP